MLYINIISKIVLLKTNTLAQIGTASFLFFLYEIWKMVRRMLLWKNINKKIEWIAGN